MIKHWLLLLLLVFALGNSAAAQANKFDTRQGFVRQHFTFDGLPAFIIEPKKVLEGKPWVLRGQFPDWHTDTDSILLERGFHIAYINNDEMYGAPKAMMIWDKFYDFLVHEKGFAYQTALIGVSRGGLYVYGWAKRNPEKVACILAEGPVCDFKSWPGGKGDGAGSAESWALLQSVYGFKSEAEAMTYKDNPMDNLEGLAGFKVPVLHLVSMTDEIVPTHENTLPLVNNYVKLGGPIQVYVMTRSKQTLQGHHYAIEHPGRWADFIEQNSFPVKKIISPGSFVQQRAGLPNLKRAIGRSDTVRVAFLGGSITYGAGWRTSTMRYLQELYPAAKFQFINAGIPSLGSLPHVFRLKNDVLDKGKIDLLFVECAVNDHTNATDSALQVRNIEGIIRQVKQANAATDIVLMAFAQPASNDACAKGVSLPEIANQELLATHYGLPSINLAKAVYEKMKAGEFSWEFDFKDLHPSPFGHEIYCSTIKQLLFDNEFKYKPQPSQDLPKALSNAFAKGDYLPIDQAKPGQGWRLVADWVCSDGKEMREGFHHVPVLESTAAGSTLTLDFRGNAIGICVLSGPDAGRLQYKIDGKKARTIDLRTEWSNYLHLPWYLMLDGDLGNGKHRLEITLLPPAPEHASGNAARIVRFLVNGA